MLTSNYEWAEAILKKYFSEKNIKINNLVEIGSRDALDAIYLSNCFNCDAQIFEPDPLNIVQCKKNIQSKLGSHIVNLHEVALADQSGEMNFFSVDPNLYENRGASSLYLINFNNRKMSDPDNKRGCVQKKIKVKVSRFDELDLPTPNLIAMDVQGSELNVLKGFGNKLSDVSAIVLETSFSENYIGGSNFYSIHKYLTKYGFLLYGTNRNGRISKKFLRRSLWSKFFNKFENDFDCIYLK
jgi:FkbM family methyltransferase